MRTYFALALALCLTGFAGMTLAAEGHHRDGYRFHGGKGFVIRGGVETPITAEVTLGSGVHLLPDGWVVLKDGRRERWSEDRWYSLEGEVLAAEAGDAVVVGTDDYYYIDDGRVYVYRNNTPVLVTTEVVFDDGRRLTPEGFIVYRDGRRERMDINIGLSLKGKVVENRRDHRNNNRNDNKNNNNNATNKNYRSPEADTNPRDTARKIEENKNEANRNANEANRETNRTLPDTTREPKREPSHENRPNPAPAAPRTEGKSERNEK